VIIAHVVSFFGIKVTSEIRKEISILGKVVATGSAGDSRIDPMFFDRKLHGCRQASHHRVITMAREPFELGVRNKVIRIEWVGLRKAGKFLGDHSKTSLLLTAQERVNKRQSISREQLQHFNLLRIISLRD
jgi:hypothetical protein